MNKVKLIGNVGGELVLKSFDNTKLASFSLATHPENMPKIKGKTYTEWHNIIAWGSLADSCKDLVKKGKQVIIEGRLKTRYYTDHFNRRVYITEIVAQNISEIKRVPAARGFFLE